LKVRVRFAPSPTGELHIGGARTALFNWLFARHHKGTFILRIEDTDLERSRREYEEGILEDLRWLGLDWDEFYRQSERLQIYRSYANCLLEEGKAYWCYCTDEELEEAKKRAQLEKRPPLYEGRCRRLAEMWAQGGKAKKEAEEQYEKFRAEGREPAVRFKVQSYVYDPNRKEWEFIEGAPKTIDIVVDDLIKGEVSFKIINPLEKEGAAISDFVILKSNNTPTYNFAAAVDDHLTQITHVIRGDEHLNNTPKQILIYQAFGWKPPAFAHMPLTLGPDRAKLSKRHHAHLASVPSLRERGYLPEALINFLVRLGWSYGDQEIFSLDELIEKFSIENMGKSQAIFDEDKLLWLNQHYIKTGDPRRLGKLLREFLIKEGIDYETLDKLEKAVVLWRERVKTLVELASSARFLFSDDFKYDPEGVEKFFSAEKAPLLERLAWELEGVEDKGFTSSTLEVTIRSFLKSQGKKLKDIAQTCRLALTGKLIGPGLFEVMEALGKEEVCRRLRRAVSQMKDLRVVNY
jgi:glutamyl-tRNA synthetase